MQFTPVMIEKLTTIGKLYYFQGQYFLDYNYGICFQLLLTGIYKYLWFP